MADDQRDQTSDMGQASESASQRAHGAHGKGDSREQDLAEPQVEPDGAEEPDVSPADGDALREQVSRGSAGWGSAGSGGSTIDKRGPEKA